MINEIKNNNFSLVLSGGGALGIAHLGVLHDLEQHNLMPAEIVGTSMGGIIGACVAVGMSEAEIYKEIEAFSSVSKWIKFSFSGNAIVDNVKIEAIFNRIFANKKMKDTNIPLKLIATNLYNGHKRVFTNQDDVYIKDAVLATMAIPGVFDEHIIEGKTYGDGFLCENLGVKEAIHDDVLAVDVLGENAFEKALPDNFFKTANVLEMLEKSMRLLIYNQSQTHIKNSKNNIYLIEPVTREYTTFSFHKHAQIRALGIGLLNKYK
ncbi:MAG TPA: patatin-like phospholipase family protein [Epsilonproteobacteria bacterium]|nr:patatin-like phospholipase family protein [Campylobacterota bacterium]